MMLKDRYDIKWVGRCRYDTSDKIWGWFLYVDPTTAGSRVSTTYAYVFWGPTSKTLSFKRHGYSSWNMDKLVRLKIDRKYAQITVADLSSLWRGEDNLFDTINNKFIFHLLANDI